MARQRQEIGVNPSQRSHRYTVVGGVGRAKRREKSFNGTVKYRRFRDTVTGYGLLAPSLFGVVLFLLLPMLVVCWLSLQHWDLLGPVRSAGLQNWRAVLTDADRASGTVLPCVCRASGPCAIELPYDSSEAMSEEPAPVVAQVTAVEQVASETVRLEVQLPEAVAFEPGQYVRITPAGADFHRSYSMANVPGTDRLQFFIRLVPGGAFSEWLAGAKPGASDCM
mgnify:CR=1 FL=1